LCYFKIIIIIPGTIICCLALYLAWFIRVDIWDDIIIIIKETRAIALNIKIKADNTTITPT